MHRYAAMMLLLLVSTPLRAEEAKKAVLETQIKIAMKVYEGDPRVKNKGASHVLSEPTLITIAGEPATFMVGGEKPLPDHPSVTLPVGLRCEVKATVIKDKEVLLELMLEHTGRVADENDDRISVQGKIVRTAAIVTPGEATWIGGNNDKESKPLWLKVTTEIVSAKEKTAVKTSGAADFQADDEGVSTYATPVWPPGRRYKAGGSAMISGPFGHGSK
jgi:hypothetical protein